MFESILKPNNRIEDLEQRVSHLRSQLDAALAHARQVQSKLPPADVVPSCSRCRWFVLTRATAKPGPISQFCQRHPPQLNIVPVQSRLGTTGAQVISQWPPVRATDFCGDFDYQPAPAEPSKE